MIMNKCYRINKNNMINLKIMSLTIIYFNKIKNINSNKNLKVIKDQVINFKTKIIINYLVLKDS